MNLITMINNIIFIIFEHVRLALIYITPNVVEHLMKTYSNNLGIYGIYLGIYLRRNMVYFSSLCLMLELMFYKELVSYFIMFYYMTIYMFVTNIYEYRYYIYPNYT